MSNSAHYANLNDNVEETGENSHRRSLVKTSLVILLILTGICLVVTLCASVGLLYAKTNRIEQNYRENVADKVGLRQEDLPTGDRMSSESEIRDEKNARLSEMHPDDSLDYAADDTVTEVDEDLEDTDAEQQQIGPLAVHLVGNIPFKSLRRKQDGGNYIVNIWNESLLSEDSEMAVEDNKAIVVQRKGMYQIYAQLSWRMKRGIASYEILKSGEDSRVADAVTLAQCVTSFTETYAVMDSCYTSVTVPLEKDDRLIIAVKEEKLTLDFQNGNSFFGVVLLQESKED